MTNRFFQGSYGTPGNFELAILDGSNPQRLIHFFRNNANNAFTWIPGDLNQHAPTARDIVTNAATSSAAVIQSTFGTPPHPGNFELLVLEGNNLVHWYRDNSNSGNGWGKGGIVSTKATGAASLIQSTFREAPNAPGNFEAVVLEGNNLVHYWRNNASTPFTWKSTKVITSKATGPGCIIQSTYGSPAHPGNFEVIVPEGNNLRHYWRDNADTSSNWQLGGTVSTTASGDPGSLIQSDYGVLNGLGNFEVVVPEGGHLVHYWRNNSSGGGNEWNRSVPISDVPISGPGTLIQSSYKSGTPNGNLEVVVVERTKGATYLVHRYRDEVDENKWKFGTIITPFPSSDAGVH